MLITSAKKLRDKFDGALAKMQRLCRHKKSSWMEYHWAPGHFDGMVRVCDNCEKILEAENEAQK